MKMAAMDEGIKGRWLNLLGIGVRPFLSFFNVSEGVDSETMAFIKHSTKAFFFIKRPSQYIRNVSDLGLVDDGTVYFGDELRKIDNICPTLLWIAK